MPDAHRHLLIRADAGGVLGSGHVMRMLALAQAHEDRGGSAALACATCPEGLAERVRGEAVGLERLSNVTPGTVEDVTAVIALAKSLQAQWVVLDGYHFGTAYQRSLRAEGLRVLAVDDYGHCESWAADAVLNQNIYAPELGYRTEPNDCRLLLGTRFALLRREFRKDVECGEPVNGGGSWDDSVQSSLPSRAASSLCRILVTLGGVDAENATGRILAALDGISGPCLEIRVLAGAGNPHFYELLRQAAASPHRMEVLRNVTDMPRQYRWADGVISAGGSTCWEWLLYRLPAAVVCLADNQRPVIAGLVKHGLAQDLGWLAEADVANLASRLRSWVLQPGSRPAMRGHLEVDGHGAERVASILDGTNTWLRRAKAEDARIWFEWANDPAVRANGFHPDPIPWETHLDWFGRHRTSPDSRLWTGVDSDDHPLGYVRLHRRDASEWEVGVAIAAERRGQGVGVSLVRLALQRFRLERATAGEDVSVSSAKEHSGPERVVARVKPANAASLKLFRTLGFRDDPRCRPDCCVLVRLLVK